MMTFIKIAWRNITRNKRRSYITTSAIGFGLGALIFIWSFVEGAHQQMIENYTSLLTSHIQIHKEGFHQNPKLETTIDDPMAIIKTLTTVPSVKAVAPRIKTVGLVSSAETSAGVMVMGIDPRNEPNVSSLHKRIKQGRFLTPESTNEILVSVSLAKNLNVGLNDKLVVMSQGMDGSIAAGNFHVAGLFDTGAEEIDKGIVLVPLSSAREIFVMPEAVSELALRVTRVEESVAAAAAIREKISGFEVLPWQEISPSFQQWIEFDNGFIWLIVIIVMIVVAIGILNTVLMGVLERTREFGILLALGTNQRQIVQMVTWESIFLGMMGSSAGVLVSSLLVFYFGHAGIDLSLFTSALNSFYMDAFIYPRLKAFHILMSLGLVFATSMIVSIYPAWHASRLKPVEAIRSI